MKKNKILDDLDFCWAIELAALKARKSNAGRRHAETLENISRQVRSEIEQTPEKEVT